MPKLEYYIPVGRQRLRCGYTTGTCAAAAARGAAQALLTGIRPAGVEIDTPAGVRVQVELLDWSAGADWAMCAVEKDGGDDPDVTDGMRIYARVSRRSDGTLRVDGGEGVGRVTRPGLDQPPGAAAINSTPRRMIAEQLAAALREAGDHGGLEAVISVPGGEALARKTFNPRLGIQGGISILGTSGIVRPMSEAALVDSITLELDMAYAAGVQHLLVTPGNYGEDYARDHLGLETEGCISCSNYLGAAIDHAAGLGFSSFLLVGHLGKLVKVAGGAMNTHSRTADGRRETMAAHAALCGAPRGLVERVFEAATTDAALELLEEAGLREDVMASLTRALYENLRHRAGEEMEIQAVVFSNRFGLLGQTPGASELLARHRRGEGESL
ncbi:cobalt-precorrin-5B (C(1))-methyltransferase CbiD [Clostridium sp. J1101437_171009_A5]|uniref:cobalt-precorrin-5B (C(1))-methyltransferase CbiD n=1 Tax=Clostridium sp. J1101437_171009_A5 TaxID=2787098 RepID=UPI00189A80D8|nr:cobalt-precorrin-5B (C(1))-methyltransferase CbiD [Clostridium sp. J1101437_171009_A5]